MRRAAALAATIICMGCGSAGTGEDAVDPAAKAAFWEAFGAGDLPKVAAARDRLIAALAAHPNDAEAARLAGMGSALTTLEGGMMAAPFDPRMGDIENALKYTEQAVNVSPDERTRVWNYTFYGDFLFARATNSGDAMSAQHARDLLNQSAEMFPIHGLFNLGSFMARAAIDSPDFESALDAYFRAYQICARAPAIDRQMPDLGGALAGPFPDAVCGNLSKVPHNIQGELFTFADALVKHGQPDAARAVFEAIKKSDGYATWAYRDRVDERLASDLAARAAQYRTAMNPGSQPQIGASPCLACHQR